MSQGPQLSKELAELFASAKPVSASDLTRLKKAGEEIDRDHVSRAELQKALFVNAILAALKKDKLTKSELARRMKCARQYVNNILDEDSSVNFTIETISNVAAACNRRAEIVVLSDDEWVQVVKGQRSAAFDGFGERNFLPMQNISSSIVYSLNFSTEILRNNITTHDFSPRPIESVA